MSKHLVRWGVVVTALLAVPGHHDEVDDQPQPVTATSDPLAMSTSNACQEVRGNSLLPSGIWAHARLIA